MSAKLEIVIEVNGAIYCVQQNIESWSRTKSGVKPPHSIKVGITISREIQ